MKDQDDFGFLESLEAKRQHGDLNSERCHEKKIVARKQRFARIP